ncbi:CG15247 [Drosophila busckii]|uniref:CG15247 n=1 Tax=Drosophila busckii TaxID=30019 RepID=A0A0M3QYW6_DROBS|nr:putative uncharacterized protein DDB_G0271606 [Drosophila busckii]ALC48329.1 CG15247 [Drosophila busckii]
MSKQQQQQQQQQQQDQDADAQEEYDPLANLLSLQLRKPAHWNWELSTSRSCNNIALPRILLYDHEGTLLLQTDGRSEQTYRQQQQQQRRRKRAATSNLEQSLQQQSQSQLPQEFHGLQIGEATPTRSSSAANSWTDSHRQRQQQQQRERLAGSCIDFSTHELPDWQPHEAASSRRSSSLRGVRFEDEQPQSPVSPVYPTPPSTSTLTTTANSSSSGPREKRRYRRSQSSGQRSILERFSMSRGRHSSPEYAQETQLEHAPRYYLRSSKAGTLVIKEESFSRLRQRRRRQKCSSSENMLSAQAERSSSVVQVAARRVRTRERQQPQPQLSSSEAEEQHEERARGRQPRLRRNQRNCGKDAAAQELITVDPGNCVQRATAR